MQLGFTFVVNKKWFFLANVIEDDIQIEKDIYPCKISYKALTNKSLA